MGKQLFVLDYDGVVLNSLYEKFVVGFNGYLNIAGSSPLFDARSLDFRDYQRRMSVEPHVFDAFRRFVPMIGDLGENAAVFRLIEAGEQILDRESFRRRIAAFGNDFLQCCSTEVLRLRGEYADMDDYDNLCPGFMPVIRTIQALSDRIDFAICTTKPLQNVQHFNNRLGISRQIRRVFVCDDVVLKVDFLRQIATEYSREHPEIGFIDDFARHLIPANDAGFSCFYAKWGFGGDGDRKAVLQAGIESVNLHDFSDMTQEFVASRELRKRVT